MSKSLSSYIFLILLTFLALFWPSIDHQILHAISICYGYLMKILQPFIENRLFRQMVVVIIVPLFFALFPAFIYWIIKRRGLPQYMIFVWFFWLVLMTMILVRQGSHL